MPKDPCLPVDEFRGSVSPAVNKVERSPFRPLFPAGLAEAIRFVVTARA